MIPVEQAALICRKVKGKTSIMVYRWKDEMHDDPLMKGARVTGACMKRWPDLTDDQRYKWLTQGLLDMVEFHGAKIRMGRDCLDDWVEGYREWIRGESK